MAMSERKIAVDEATSEFVSHKASMWNYTLRASKFLFEFVTSADGEETPEEQKENLAKYKVKLEVIEKALTVFQTINPALYASVLVDSKKVDLMKEALAENEQNIVFVALANAYVAASEFFSGEFQSEVEAIKLHNILIKTQKEIMLKNRKVSSEQDWLQVHQLLGKLSIVIVDAHPEFFDECLQELNAIIADIDQFLVQAQLKENKDSSVVHNHVEWLMKLRSAKIDLCYLMYRYEDVFETAKILLDEIKAISNESKETKESKKASQQKQTAWLTQNLPKIKEAAISKFNDSLGYLQGQFDRLRLCTAPEALVEAKVIAQKIIVLTAQKMSFTQLTRSDLLTDKKCREFTAGNMLEDKEPPIETLDPLAADDLYAVMIKDVLEQRASHYIFSSGMMLIVQRAEKSLKLSSSTAADFNTRMEELNLGSTQTKQYIARACQFKLIDQAELRLCYTILDDINLKHKLVTAAAKRLTVVAQEAPLTLAGGGEAPDARSIFERASASSVLQQRSAAAFTPKPM